MKTNVRLEVSDEIRNALACLIAGKACKRLATREEVGEYVAGALERLASSPAVTEPELEELESRPGDRTRAAAASAPPHPIARLALTAAEEREAGRLRAEGKTESYVRGWIVGGRMVHGARA